MIDELSLETFVSISQKKFEIYLLDKKNLKNIYMEEFYFENDSDQIDYDKLRKFLDKNVFKIEKLIGNFIKNVNIIIESNQILNFSVGIKKKNYGETINKSYLESSLTDLKDLFKENYNNNKIIHLLINRYSIDGINYKSFDEKINGDHLCVEVKFISVPNILIKEISNVLEKYQIKINHIFEGNYIKNFFGDKHLDLSVVAFKIQSGHNQNEITLVPKSLKKAGFFEKFFQLFS